MIERRYVTAEFEVRAKADGGHLIEGHAAVFNRLSQNLGGFVEQVAPGAFTKTIKEADVRALFNHDPNVVLGRNKAGTLRLAEDNVGLHYEVDLPATTVADDLVESMKRGDVTQSSFGFSVIDDEWGLTEQDFPLRTLKELKLYDVSPVTFPAYLDADASLVRVALRSLAEARHVDLDALCEVAARRQLSDVIRGEVEQPGAPTAPALRRRRLVLMGKAMGPLA